MSGETTVEFTVGNQGDTAAGAFDVWIVLSDDDVIGNADDQIVATISVGGLAENSTSVHALNLSLPVATLYQWSLRDDPQISSINVLSSDVFHLGLVIDPSNTVPESDESNNLNRGQGMDRDDATFFPWDSGGNGSVGPSDAIFVINRLGQTSPPADSRADPNGSGSVTPSDAIAVINRIGYLRNGGVMETTSLSATSMGPPLLDQDSEGENDALIGLSVAFTDADGNSINEVGVGEAFQIFVFAQDLRTSGSHVGVGSAFADMTFDTNLIDVNEIVHLFDDFTSGAIDNAAGTVDEAGGFKNSRPANRDRQAIFYLNATARGTGTLHVATHAADGVFSENTLFGVDGDLRAQTIHGIAQLAIAEVIASWQNPVNRFDVNGDGEVIPLDVLDIINYINSNPETTLPLPSNPPPYVDVNGDGDVTALDVLEIIKHINGANDASAGAEAERGVAEDVFFGMVRPVGFEGRLGLGAIGGAGAAPLDLVPAADRDAASEISHRRRVAAHDRVFDSHEADVAAECEDGLLDVLARGFVDDPGCDLSVSAPVKIA